MFTVNFADTEVNLSSWLCMYMWIGKQKTIIKCNEAPEWINRAKETEMEKNEIKTRKKAIDEKKMCWKKMKKYDLVCLFPNCLVNAPHLLWQTLNEEQCTSMHRINLRSSTKIKKKMRHEERAREREKTTTNNWSCCKRIKMKTRSCANIHKTMLIKKRAKKNKQNTQSQRCNSKCDTKVLHSQDEIFVTRHNMKPELRNGVEKRNGGASMQAFHKHSNATSTYDHDNDRFMKHACESRAEQMSTL